MRRGSAEGGGEARNPPLPVADTGGCSANEATSFASVSAAKRLCRIVRVVAAAAALSFNSYDNGYFVAYTSPPPTAEPLLKEKPFGGWLYQLLHPATPDSRTQPRPRGTPMQSARAGEARPRGKAGSERRKACFHPGGSGFHLLREHTTLLPSNSNPTSFYVTHRFFVSFLTQERNVTPRPPFVPLRSSSPRPPVPFWEPPRALAKQLKHFCAFMQCFIARKLHFIHTFGIIYGEKLWITWTTKWG